MVIKFIYDLFLKVTIPGLFLYTIKTEFCDTIPLKVYKEVSGNFLYWVNSILFNCLKLFYNIGILPRSDCYLEIRDFKGNTFAHYLADNGEHWFNYTGWNLFNLELVTVAETYVNKFKKIPETMDLEVVKPIKASSSGLLDTVFSSVLLDI